MGVFLFALEAGFLCGETGTVWAGDLWDLTRRSHVWACLAAASSFGGWRSRMGSEQLGGIEVREALHDVQSSLARRVVMHNVRWPVCRAWRRRAYVCACAWKPRGVSRVASRIRLLGLMVGVRQREPAVRVEEPKTIDSLLSREMGWHLQVEHMTFSPEANFGWPPCS